MLMTALLKSAVCFIDSSCEVCGNTPAWGLMCVFSVSVSVMTGVPMSYDFPQSNRQIGLYTKAFFSYFSSSSQLFPLWVCHGPSRSAPPRELLGSFNLLSPNQLITETRVRGQAPGERSSISSKDHSTL